MAVLRTELKKKIFTTWYGDPGPSPFLDLS